MLIKGFEPFLSTPSARRATLAAHLLNLGRQNFYPRPPRGGRPRGRHHLQRVAGIFLSTPSARRATQGAEEGSWPLFISIHALREEGDSKRLHWLGFASDFYPRPPRGGRPTTKTWHHRPQKFLSTPSARRATAALWRSAADARDFYPRPPRGGRHVKKAEAVFKRSFLSTPSARRATISGSTPSIPCWYFYPRPPRGGRRAAPRPSKCGGRFLSTPSARRATCWFARLISADIFLSTPSARRATAIRGYNSARN